MRPPSHPPPAGGGGAAQQGTVITTKAGPPDKAPEEEPGDGLPTLCLKQVYPKYTKQFQYLCLVDRIATLFLRFLGIKGNMRLGPTAFRTFIRYWGTLNGELASS